MPFTDFSVSRDNPLDLTAQIAEKLAAAIRSGSMKPGEKLPGEKELAKLFGVSHVTVASACSQLTSMGLLIRRPRRGTFVADRVIQARRNEGRRIHVIVSHVDMFRGFMGGLSAEAERHGVELVLTDCGDCVHWTRERIQERVDRIPTDGSAGLLLYPAHYVAPRLGDYYRELRESGRPTVFLFEGARFGAEAVTHDNHLGIAMTVRHLYALGHRHLGYVDFQPWTVEMDTLGGRREGFHTTCRELGIDIRDRDHLRIKFGGPAEPAAHPHAWVDQCRPWLDRKDRPTGIVGMNDNTAMAVWLAAEELGLAVPEDLSITGFDNAVYGQLPTHPMTTLDAKFDRIGAYAVRRAIELMDGKGKGKPQQKYIKPELVVRGSTASPRVRARECGGQ